MAIDRYVKTILTVIAAALVYLAIVLTPMPTLAAQTQGLVKPGDITGPMQVVIVGWAGKPGDALPIVAAQPLPTTVQNTVQVNGRVATERSSGTADRVVLVGWEERGDTMRASNFRAFDTTTPRPGLPTTTIPR